jgi:NNP family nitrate/nitrite transporter-like MFS transporter
VWLTVTLLGEGVFLIAFSRMGVLGPAILVMLVFSLFVQMAEGATFALVPFVNRRSIGTVAGIVGAGGNVGAVAAGFLFRTSMPTEQILLATGAFVCLAAGASVGLRFSPNTQAEEREAFALATGAARGTAAAPAVG